MTDPIQLTKQDHVIAYRVYNQLMSNIDDTKPFVSKQSLNIDNKNPTKEFSSLLEHTLALLKSYNFSCNIDRWFIEGQRYHSTGRGVITPLAWHLDDGGAWSENYVATVIYYLKKDPELSGGNLKYNLGNNDPDMDYTSREYPKIIVASGNTVLMNGDLWHCPENISGYGDRELLVIQLPQCR